MLCLVLVLWGVAVSCAYHPSFSDAAPAAGATDAPKPLSPRERAREEFSQTVRTWGRVLTLLLVLVGVAALLLSFLPAGHLLGLSTPEALAVLGISATVPIAQYMLQAWGVIAADLAAVLTLAGLVAAAGVMGWGWIRRHRNLVTGSPA